jgi:hypothetical protein
MEPPKGVLPGLLAMAPAALRRRAPASVRWIPRGTRSPWPSSRELLRTGATREAMLRSHGVDPELDRLYLHVAERKHDRAYPFAFLVTVARGHGVHGRMQHVPLAAALREHADDPQARQRLLAPLRRAAAVSPSIRALVESGEVYHPVAWTAAQAHALLRATAELAGQRAADPGAGLVAEAGRRARRSASRSAPTGRPSSASARCSTSRCATSSARTSSAPTSGAPSWAAPPACTSCAASWVELDPARHAEALRHWQSIEAAADRGQISFADGMRLLAGLPRDSLSELTPAAWTVATPGPWLARMLGELQSPSGSPETDPGPALHGTLRPTSATASPGCGCSCGSASVVASPMTWASARRSRSSRCCSSCASTRVPGPHLIVLPPPCSATGAPSSPASAPTCRVHTAHRSVPDGDAPAADVDVVLTTYATLQRQAWLKDQAWGLVVLDEAQAIKNAQTKQARAVKALHDRHRGLLTGTPVENSLVDLWSLFDFAQPRLLGAKGTSIGTRAPRATERRRVRAAAVAGPPVHPAPPQDRPIGHRGPARQDRGAGLLRAVTRAGGALRRGRRRRSPARLERGSRAIPPRRRHPRGADALQADLQSPVAVAAATVCIAPRTAESSSRSQRALRRGSRSAGEKVLVFTQFREMCAPLAAFARGGFGARA